jgi:putative aminopeptidase FrvX
MNRLAGLLALAFATAIVAAFLFAWQSLTHAPQAGNGSFATERAYATLQNLLAEQVPHPTGSPENQRVRDRIVAELRAAGYEPEVQSAFQCAPPDKSPGCTQVENIIAVLKGTGEGRAILATAHYDSVPAGPGVGDDGVGVVVMLELARALKATPPARNDVIFLITDGEETGLRGAVAFARNHPLMQQVEIVVNVEARGNTGPAIMFETGTGNSQLIRLFADAVGSQVSNSLAYEIYRLLPNDTDFTIYKNAGLNGYNFAMIGDAARYHTPKDNLALLDRNTLRHHGEQVTALVRALQAQDLENLRSKEDASYFDLFGKGLVHWPASLNLPMALAALVLLVGIVVTGRASLSLAGVIWSLASLLVLPFGMFAIGWILSYPLGIWPEVHVLDHQAPWPARIALLGATFAVATITAHLLASRTEPQAVTLVYWLFLSLLAVASAAALPGASYAFLWPVMIFALVAGLGRFIALTAAIRWASVAGFVAIAMFWTGHMLALDAVVGFPLSQFKILALFPMAMALVPLFMMAAPLRNTVLAIPVVLTVATAALASTMPGYTPDNPRPLNIVYHQDADTGDARWLVQETPIDRSFMQRAGFGPAPERIDLAGLVPTQAYVRKATSAGLEAPSLDLVSREEHGDKLRLSGQIRSVRAGFVFGLIIPPGSGIAAVTLEGQPLLTPERLASGKPVWARIFGTANKPLSIAIEHAKTGTGRVVVFERSALPDTPEAGELMDLRPRNASPVHAGDGAFVFRTLDLNAVTPTRQAAPLP